MVLCSEGMARHLGHYYQSQGMTTGDDPINHMTMNPNLHSAKRRAVIGLEVPWIWLSDSLRSCLESALATTRWRAVFPTLTMRGHQVTERRHVPENSSPF